MNDKSDSKQNHTQASVSEVKYREFSSSSRKDRSYSQWKLLGQAADSFERDTTVLRQPDNSVLANDFDSRILPNETESFLIPQRRTVSEFSGQLYQKSSSLKDLVNSKVGREKSVLDGARKLGNVLNSSSVRNAQSPADRTHPSTVSPADKRNQTPVISSALGQFRSFSETRPSLALQNNGTVFNSDNRTHNSPLPSNIEQRDAHGRDASRPNTIMGMIKNSPQNISAQQDNGSMATSFSARNYQEQQNGAGLMGYLHSRNGAVADKGQTQSMFGQATTQQNQHLSSSRTLKDLIGKNRTLDDRQQAPISVRQNVESTLRQSEEIWQRKYRGEHPSSYSTQRSSLKGNTTLRQVISGNNTDRGFSASQRTDSSYGENVYHQSKGRYSSLFKTNANARMSKNSTPENLQDIFRRIESCQ
ncbi:MAG: hypothetical protein J6M93_00810 [Succinivibrio sp.]|nr:hypothetical protein [Succinivibrio sp.]